MFWQIWFATLFIKLFLAYRLPLFFDEAYYWVWSHHVSLSYFDHPPFVAWLLWLGHAFENFGNGARFPSVIVGHLTLLVWIQILKPAFSKEQLKWWLLLCLVNPMSGIGSIAVTPDIPLLFFWSLSLWGTLRALETQKLKWYLLIGASAGLGFVSKYHMVFFIPIVFLWLTMTKQWRAVRPGYLALTVILGLLMTTPVILWNYQHDWASFKFQLNRGLAQPFEPKWVFDYVGAQIGILFPTIIWLALRRNERPVIKWIPYFGALPFIFFFFTSFKGRVEPNWTAIAVPVVLALAVLGSGPRFRTIKTTLGIWLFAIALFASHLIHPWLPVKPSALKTYEFVAYEKFLPFVESHKPLYVSSYQMASYFYYKTRIPTFKIRGTHRTDHFDYMPESLPKEDVFYSLFGVWNKMPQWLVENYNMEVLIPDLPDDFRLLKFTKK